MLTKQPRTIPLSALCWNRRDLTVVVTSEELVALQSIFGNFSKLFSLRKGLNSKINLSADPGSTDSWNKIIEDPLRGGAIKK